MGASIEFQVLVLELVSVPNPSVCINRQLWANKLPISTLKGDIMSVFEFVSLHPSQQKYRINE